MEKDSWLDYLMSVLTVIAILSIVLWAFGLYG